MPATEQNVPPARSSLWRAGSSVALALAGFTSGCAGLPKDVDRPVTAALPSHSVTALGQLVDTQRIAAGARHPSGFALLSGPQDAYGSRLALVEAAQKTLDLQYYAIHADTSSERLLRGVVAAARRGVRVRVLLDDFHSTGRDAQVMRLAFVPNIEMRMFNPLTGARSSALGRVFSILGDFSRVQQRMHNKLFIADNALGVTGGRNLGDAYFGHADAGNFVDLDVLAAGPVVRELSRSFDSYWNNERAYPVQSLITPQELSRMRESQQALDAAPRADAASAALAASAPDDVPSDRLKSDGEDEKASKAVQRTRIWDQQPMDLGQVRFVWAPAAVLVDQPAKIPPDNTSRGTLPEQPPAVASPVTIASRVPLGASTRKPMGRDDAGHKAPPTAPPPAPDDPTPASTTDPQALEAQTDTVVDGLLQLMGQAKSDLLVVSPYFVPGPDMKQAFAHARSRGVRVRVLTNSLASNDAPIAHAGYARHRPDLLAMGVELYEMRSEFPSGLRGALGSTGSGSGGDPSAGGPGSSRAMLHSKLVIVDGRLLTIGSMNLDIRSQKQNTELALLIRSAELSRRAAQQIEAAFSEAAWHVQLTDNQSLLWRAPPNSGLADRTSEPDASAPLRLMLKLLGPLAPDHLL